MKYFFFSFVCALWFPIGANAQNPMPPKEIVADGKAYQIANKVTQEVLSPFCPGKTIAMCTSPDAASTRREIQMWAVSGKSVNEIKEKLIEEFGEEYRMVALPWWDNVGLLIGLGLGFLFAIAMVIFVSKKKTTEPKLLKNSENENKSDEEDDDDYRDALRSQYND